MLTMNYLDLLPCDVMDIVLDKRAYALERSLFILENTLYHLNEDLKELQIIKYNCDEYDKVGKAYHYGYCINYCDISYSCEEYLFSSIGYPLVVFIYGDGDFMSNLCENPTYYEGLKEANELYNCNIDSLETAISEEDDESILDTLDCQLDSAKNHRFLQGFQLMTRERFEKKQGFNFEDYFDNCDNITILVACFGS